MAFGMEAISFFDSTTPGSGFIQSYRSLYRSLGWKIPLALALANVDDIQVWIGIRLLPLL